MTADQFEWPDTSLDEQDQKLINAYLEVGVTIDSLPYTPYFDQLLRKAGYSEPTEPQKADVFRRLRRLRKSGQLPALIRTQS